MSFYNHCLHDRYKEIKNYSRITSNYITEILNMKDKISTALWINP